jgi:hypothetical protein
MALNKYSLYVVLTYITVQKNVNINDLTVSLIWAVQCIVLMSNNYTLHVYSY